MTDHKPLTYISALNLSSSRLIRWKMRLQEYSFKIVHKAGKEHINADVLSRLYENVTVSSIEEELKIDDDYMRRMQYTDDEIRATIKNAKAKGGKFNQFELVDGILYCVKKNLKSCEPQQQKRLVVPRILVGQVLTVYHDHVCSAHLGKKQNLDESSQSVLLDGNEGGRHGMGRNMS